MNRFINNHNEFDNLLLQRLYTENKREKIALLDGNLKSNSTWYTLWVHIVHFIYHLHSRLYCLPLMLRVFPPKRKHSQSSGRGVLEASTNTFTLLMSIPRRSKMGWIEALSKRFKIHIFFSIKSNFRVFFRLVHTFVVSHLRFLFIHLFIALHL